MIRDTHADETTRNNHLIAFNYHLAQKKLDSSPGDLFAKLTSCHFPFVPKAAAALVVVVIRSIIRETDTGRVITSSRDRDEEPPPPATTRLNEEEITG